MVAETSALVQYEDALRLVIENAALVESEQVRLDDVAGRVLSSSVRTETDLPRFNNSAVDGFAIAEEDVEFVATNTFRLAGEIRAGGPPKLLRHGEVLRIFTGAMVPAGCAAIVMQEDAEVDGSLVQFRTHATRGDHIRVAGSEARAGTEIVCDGPVSPATIAALAASGVTRVEVRRRLRVGIVSTGDELVQTGGELAPGQIYESNSTALRAAAEALGCEVRHVILVPDTRVKIENACRAVLGDCDLLLTSGGVSVGAHDLVRPALAASRVEEHFWGVAMKPGKPVAFGTCGGSSVFGLPGNPVSAMVCFSVLVRPHILARTGCWQGFTEVSGRLLQSIKKKRGRVEFVPAHYRQGQIDPFVDRASYKSRLLAGANALAVVPSECSGANTGEEIQAILLQWGLS
ncbi:MAG: gephyrin-like molybdotransferase Glp [Fimbriimonadaceae bacterium]